MPCYVATHVVRWIHGSGWWWKVLVPRLWCAGILIWQSNVEAIHQLHESYIKHSPWRVDDHGIFHRQGYLSWQCHVLKVPIYFHGVAKTFLKICCRTIFIMCILWARGSVAHMKGWPDFKMAAPINVLAFTRDFITGKQMLASKCT